MVKTVTPAKKVAMALAELITTSYQRHIRHIGIWK
jgi:uncharacterized protein with von Willebrand factor type A (vWA) domain